MNSVIFKNVTGSADSLEMFLLLFFNCLLDSLVRLVSLCLLFSYFFSFAVRNSDVYGAS